MTKNAEAGTMARLQKRVAKLEKALHHIANPIAVIQAEAKAQGMSVDGGMAVRLSDDPNYLKGIAREALANVE